MNIVSVARAFPPHYYDQQTLLAALKERFGGRPEAIRRMDNLHRNVLVGGRHLALPLEAYARLEHWGQANDAWIQVAGQIAAEALEGALERAGLEPGDLSALFFASVTGVATPSIDARLMNQLPLSPHLKRIPIFGLGCVAGAAGLARAADYVRAFPGQVAALICVELCSLTLQWKDLSVANQIATGLFGDGGAAALVAGRERKLPGPRIVATRSIFYPKSLDVMGWKISGNGFGLVLSAEVPAMVRCHLREDVDSFLSAHHLSRQDMARWICHPGGPKVLRAVQQALEIPRAALDGTWQSLARVGNLSSASVLLILEDNMKEPPPPGSHGLLSAMGPGFCTELVLLRW
ncbi:MAG: type III polyketide synthase [Acidobacteriota bacterium]